MMNGDVFDAPSGKMYFFVVQLLKKKKKNSPMPKQSNIHR